MDPSNLGGEWMYSEGLQEPVPHIAEFLEDTTSPNMDPPGDFNEPPVALSHLLEVLKC